MIGPSLLRACGWLLRIPSKLLLTARMFACVETDSEWCHMGTRLDAGWSNLTNAERIQRYRLFAEEARELSLSAASPHRERYADYANRWELLAEVTERKTNQMRGVTSRG